MQPSAEAFPILAFLGVLVQLGGSLMLIALFVMLRRFVLRRAYFSAWANAWTAVSVSVFALAMRYVFVPGLVGAPIDDRHPAARVLYFAYQTAKGIAFVYFLRGTLTYVAGPSAHASATRRLWLLAAIFALVSTLATRHGLNEMIIWQSAIAVPALGYCASALLWLPRPRRTTGSTTTGIAFALLSTLWLAYAGAFGIAITKLHGPVVDRIRWLVQINSYFDLSLNLLLGYAMIRVLMEDAKREMDDAHAELRVTHDRLARAALYDPMTETLNRRAYVEGVGLEVVRATFGTVVIADVDNLKLANDRFGHSTGDQLVRRCADVLRDALRQYDKLYRWGGDEFLVVMPSAHAADVLERLRAVIAQAEPVVPAGGGQPLRLHVSLGASDYASSAELSAAIERADTAMYEEKGRRKSDPAHAQLEHEFGSASVPALR